MRESHARFQIGVVAALVALALASDAAATVKKVSVTATVRAGTFAALTVAVAPRAECKITVTYGGVRARAAGLGPKSGGRIKWRWRVGAKAPAGAARAVVRCGGSGSLRVAFRVSRSAPPPPLPGPGRLIDVGGYRLYLDCAGSGSPTIVLESGFGAPGASLPPSSGWRTLGPALSAETRVCAYDRAGLGASDSRPAGRRGTSSLLATELRALLRNGGIEPPYVFYGPSIGAFFALSHLAHWQDPTEIAGFVFGDAAGCVTICSGGAFELVDLDVTGAASLGSRPMIALTSTEPEIGAGLAARSSNAFWIEAAPGVGHHLSEEAPQFVAEAIRLVVGAVRSGGSLPPCAETQLPALGGHCR